MEGDPPPPAPDKEYRWAGVEFSVETLGYLDSPTSSNEFKRINSEWLWLQTCAETTLPRQVFNFVIP